MLAENRAAYEATGCYRGVTDPHVLQRDPVKAELFHTRMLSALIAGREKTKMISASPLVREVAELAIGIYTPEGDNIAQSTGIQAHSRSMGKAIQWMIEQGWEDKVGIAPGDLFWFNETSIAGMHPADVYDILPIFWQGELVAWAVTVIMEMDIGAISPGCMPAPNIERSTDGVRFAGEKVGSNDQLRHDIHIKCELSFDMADTFLLDRKGAIAANIHIRGEVEKMIEEFGLDYFKSGSAELIELERRNQLERLRRRTVPGRYRNVAVFEYFMKDQPLTWLAAKKTSYASHRSKRASKPRGASLLISKVRENGAGTVSMPRPRACGGACPSAWCRRSPMTAGRTLAPCYPLISICPRAAFSIRRIPGPWPRLTSGLPLSSLSVSG